MLSVPQCLDLFCSITIIIKKVDALLYEQPAYFVAKRAVYGPNILFFSDGAEVFAPIYQKTSKAPLSHRFFQF